MTRSIGDDPHGDEPILTAGAPTAAAEAALVIIHGRGATAQGVLNLFEPVYEHGLAMIAPQGARSRWLPNPVGTPIERNEPWLTSAVDRVGEAIEIARAAGIAADRTVIAGFSQGAAVAAEFTLRRRRRYGGVFVCSGTVPGSAIADRTYPDAGSLAETPVRISCSEDDPLVPTDRVRASARALEAAGGEVTVAIADDGGHAVTEETFAAVSARLSAVMDAA